MKNTFRVTPNKDDFVIWEKLQFKRSRLIPTLITAFMFIAFFAFYLIAEKNSSLIIAAVIAFVVCGAYFLYVYNVGIEKKVERYLAADAQYLSPCEITIDENTVEYRNIPMMNEAGIINVYPYSVIRAIYETENYFYFNVGFELKILPKRDIPDQMKQQVFNQIKKNANYFYIK
ncbi:MAG: hypothetical protein K2G73_02975 [Eubacterium sp.]|nr:hypothetical protein [Eubacterium sp.]